MSVSSGEGHSAVLVDPHPLWLNALAGIISSVSIDVVGRTTQPSEALELISEHRPALVVVAPEAEDDETDGIGVVEHALKQAPTVKAVIVSDRDDRQTIEEALALGVSAYILKTALPEDIAAVVRHVFGASVFLASRFHHDDTSSSGNGHRNGDEGEQALTKRELEILRLLAEGSSNAQLARMLWLSEQTVKFHLSNIYRKLGVSNRTEASRWAQVHGLLPRRLRVG